VATGVVNKEEQTRMRVEIARQCREQYGMNYGADEITDCDGCRIAGGRLFAGCRNCPVRKCASEKQLENCAHCPEYVCGNLQAHLSSDPAARIRLDEIRAGLRRNASMG
jgi:hypothetical protein